MGFLSGSKKNDKLEQELEVVTREREELAAEKIKLNREIERLQQEKGEAMLKVDQLSSNVHSNYDFSEVEDLEGKLEELKNYVESYREERDQLSTEIQMLRLDRDEINSEIASLKLRRTEFGTEPVITFEAPVQNEYYYTPSAEAPSLPAFDFEKAQNEEEASKLRISELQELIESLEQEISEKRDEISTSELRLEEILSRIDNAPAPQYFAQAETRQHNEEDFTTRREELEKNIEILKTQLDEASTEIFKLSKENNTLSSRVEALTASLEEQLSIETTIAKQADLEHNAQIETMRQEETKLGDRLNMLKRAITEMEDRESSLSSMQGGLEVRRAEEKLLQERIGKLQDEESEKKSSIRRLNERLYHNEELKNKLDNSISNLTEQVSEKGKLLDEFNAKRDLLLDDLRDKEKTLSTMDHEIMVNKDRLESILKDVNSLDEKKKLVLNELKKYAQLKTGLQQTILKVKTDEESILSTYTNLKTQIDRLEKRKVEIEEGSLQIGSGLADSIMKFAEDINSQRNQINSLKAELLERDKEISAKQRLITERTAIIAELNGQIAVLQKERTTIELMNAELKKQKTELTDDLFSIKDKEKSAAIYLNDVKLETELMMSRKDELEKELGALLTQMQKRFADNEAKKNMLGKELAYAESQFKQIQQKILLSEAELKRLQGESDRTYSPPVKQTIVQPKKPTIQDSIDAMEQDFKAQVAGSDAQMQSDLKELEDFPELNEIDLDSFDDEFLHSEDTDVFFKGINFDELNKELGLDENGERK